MLPLFESGIPLLRQRLQQLPDAGNITIAYPDEGAWKRFHYHFGDYPEVGGHGAQVEWLAQRSRRCRAHAEQAWLRMAAGGCCCRG